MAQCSLVMEGLRHQTSAGGGCATVKSDSGDEWSLEGTSFQKLKDQLPRDIAIYHLGRADLSLQQIAEQLGFSEPSAFHRAFKKWTGLTPGAYRAQEN